MNTIRLAALTAGLAALPQQINTAATAY